MNAVRFDASLVFIAGRWRAGDSGQTLPLVNPSDGSELTCIARGNAVHGAAGFLLLASTPEWDGTSSSVSSHAQENGWDDASVVVVTTVTATAITASTATGT